VSGEYLAIPLSFQPNVEVVPASEALQKVKDKQRRPFGADGAVVPGL
jgi:hypothetical protein